MRFILANTLKDLQRLRRDPASVLAGMAIPLIVTFLLALIFGDGSAKPHGRLLIIDHDHTLLSGALTAAFSQGSLRDMIATEHVETERTARERVNRDEASAALVIPKGLGAAWFSGKPAQIHLITNPAQRILPGIIEQTLSAVLDIANHPETLSNSTPLIQLETRTLARKGRNDFNIGALFFPGMLFVAVLFVSQALSVDIWREDAAGTIRRLATSTQRMEAFLAGRVLVAAVVLFGVASVGLICARLALKLPIANLPGAILWVTFSGVALFLMMLALSVCSASETASRVVLTIVLFLLGMVGGSFFPFELMPPWLSALGHWTPNGWAIGNFKAILDGSARLQQISIATLGLLAVSCLAFFGSAWRIRRAFLR